MRLMFFSICRLSFSIFLMLYSLRLCCSRFRISWFSSMIFSSSRFRSGSFSVFFFCSLRSWYIRV